MLVHSVGVVEFHAADRRLRRAVAGKPETSGCIAGELLGARGKR